MRFLIPLIVSFCFTMASFQSHAGVVYGEKTDNSIGDELPIAENTTIGYLQPIADLLYLQQQRNSKIYFNHSGVPGSDDNLFSDNKAGNSFQFLIPKFLYCKSIGLILIFPKHYFF